MDDQVTCESLELDINMFIVCNDCPFYWTLNDEIIELEQEITVDNALQQIKARLEVEGVGNYTFLWLCMVLFLAKSLGLLGRYFLCLCSD